MSTDNRLRTTMGLMARENDNEAMIALRHATRMLADRGLDWSAVASLAIGASNDNASRPQPGTQPRPQPQPTPQAKTGRIRISAHDIPQRVSGEIQIAQRERTRSGGQRVVFHIRDGNTTYGPMIAYLKGVVMSLETANLRRQSVEVTMLTKGEGCLATPCSPFMPQAGKVLPC